MFQLKFLLQSHPKHFSANIKLEIGLITRQTMVNWFSKNKFAISVVSLWNTNRLIIKKMSVQYLFFQTILQTYNVSLKYLQPSKYKHHNSLLSYTFLLAYLFIKTFLYFPSYKDEDDLFLLALVNVQSNMFGVKVGE